MGFKIFLQQHPRDEIMIDLFTEGVLTSVWTTIHETFFLYAVSESLFDRLMSGERVEVVIHEAEKETDDDTQLPL